MLQQALGEYMNIKSALEYIENIPFEEWLAFLEAKIATDFDFSIKLLNEISLNHYDESWRFNAIQLQIDHEILSADIRELIIANETSHEILNLVQEHQ